MAGRPRVRRGYVPAESEAAFAQAVQQLAKHEGWMHYHTFRSDRSAPGFPDDVFVRGVRMVFAELKRADAPPRIKVADRARVLASRPEWLHDLSITEPQAEWLEALRQVQEAVARASSAAEQWAALTDPLPMLDVCVWTPADWPAIRRTLAR